MIEVKFLLAKETSEQRGAAETVGCNRAVQTVMARVESELLREAFEQLE